jgi:hypothetical protein
MRINSEESLRTLEKVLHQYGSWSAMIDAATYEDGVYKVPRKTDVSCSTGKHPSASSN